MFNFTPPSGQNVVNSNILTPPHNGRRVLYVLVALFFGCLVVFLGYRRGSSPKPVVLDRAVFHNIDSINHYADLAFTTDDPRALFVTGIASHLRYVDPDFPKDAYTVSPDEGELLLIRAAEKGSEDAMTYIKCLSAHDNWSHPIPQVKK